MESKAAEIDDLDSGGLADYEDAWQGVEAWVEKNGVLIDAMDEIRGYIDSILEAQVEAKTQATPLSTSPDMMRSPLDHIQVQAQGGLGTLAKLGLVSSLLVAQQTKAFIARHNRKG